MRPVAVIIPTLRRPESLARAVASVQRQLRADELIREIVVVDNAPEGSAAPVVELARAASPVAMVYAHAPRPGVANARNAGLQATDAPIIAFLDDDEEAAETWLGELYDVHMGLNADVTFGPVQGRVDTDHVKAKPYLEAFFSRFGPATSGLIDESYGCGNSMLTRATALAETSPFDARANDIGGEDDRLFAKLRAERRRFAWAADAVVLEYAAEHRANMAYTLRRAMSYGSGPVQICARKSPPDVIGVLRWMVIGAGQTVVYGVGALAAWLAGSADAYALMDRTARGLGKVLWWRERAFYGEVEAARTSARSINRRPRASRVASAVKISQMKSL